MQATAASATNAAMITATFVGRPEGESGCACLTVVGAVLAAMCAFISRPMQKMAHDVQCCNFWGIQSEPK